MVGNAFHAYIQLYVTNFRPYIHCRQRDRDHCSPCSGAGGQNINKVSSAIHLRFDFVASSLPDSYKERLLKLGDQRITDEGIIVIKAQEYRSQVRNLEEALRRLREIIESVAQLPKNVSQPSRPIAHSRNVSIVRSSEVRLRS